MYRRIVISMAACLYMQAVHLNVLRAQQIDRKDTLQVMVDDHKMSMYVAGTGKYTVVLEAGGSSNHRCYRTIDTAL
ncbi:MAG TPA: hypothetical protein PLX74_11340, partial [Chitinophagaceae bacterium]|nr:hypothetical protein [Chitinophagaceae bacterium]